MWDGLFMLLSLSIVMAIASFGAGSLPLALSLSPQQLRMITALGTGVLVGTALIVIIPEGVETLYSAQPSESHAHAESEELEHDAHTSHKEPHAWVGIMLVLGFILMYLIDVLPDALSPSRDLYQPLHISLSNLSRGLHRADSPTSETPPESEPPASKSTATSIGLIIHAIADGIALGASSTTPSTSLSFIVFIAIMLHKAPASFGLTSVLLKQGVSKRLARTHLAVFALAAPTGAIGTWIAVHMLGGGDSIGDEGSMVFSTGCVLIFSGGTFLYVAMHAMQESNSPHGHHDTNGYGDSYGARQHSNHAPKKQTATEVAVMVAGMLVPLLTQFGHAH
ncbi:Zinc/iron permease [Pseudovirgaria hyperparasitica]|uniref:Zinc/iron permease n=1 Tax=Pseudovirgaria hyperparasitica TaxID=470096 RepID=A0A6A6WMV9_9PEZI|nr:Zinc/iron permease [Pseudovirgaria hyperparasitica]KAF2763478.1 Zinc/iron permease [Pseudovirgaria hyperparasitica]